MSIYDDTTLGTSGRGGVLSLPKPVNFSKEKIIFSTGTFYDSIEVFYVDIRKTN